MNRNQKIIVLIGIALIVLMGLVPPWVMITGGPIINFQTETDGGYHLILKPPPSKGFSYFKLVLSLLSNISPLGGVSKINIS